MGAAEHVAGGHQRHRHVADADRLAIGGRLSAAACSGPEPRLHDGERFPCCQHVVVPRPRMVGMAVGDDGAGRSAVGVDIEAAGAAIEAFGFDRKPRSNRSGLIFFSVV